jgi:hypothetical protein
MRRATGIRSRFAIGWSGRIAFGDEVAGQSPYIAIRLFS